jgi:hypothetical protein
MLFYVTISTLIEGSGLKTDKAQVLTGVELFYEALTSEAKQGRTRIRRKS